MDFIYNTYLYSYKISFLTVYLVLHEELLQIFGSELTSINAILAGQSNETEAFNTLKTNMTYAEEVRDGSQQQQASDERED